mmetsp:Transcript_145655/g.271233  ORF Transcript_145655/g.271233 Transcript_145655/m.271233 type:complete len:87 (+) Transcript_145655:204-464(+)
MKVLARARQEKLQAQMVTGIVKEAPTVKASCPEMARRQHRAQTMPNMSPAPAEPDAKSKPMSLAARRQKSGLALQLPSKNGATAKS